MKRAIKKLKSNIGFTLSETLITMLILVMVAGVVAEGVPSAVQAYGKAVEAANVQMALSTTVNALRNELSTAWSAECKNNEVFYISSDTGAKTKIYRDPGKNIIMVQDFLKFDSDTEHAPEADPRALVSESAVTKNLLVTFDSVEWSKDSEGAEDKSVLVFSNLKVVRNDGAANAASPELASIEKLYIRILTKDLSIPFVI